MSAHDDGTRPRGGEGESRAARWRAWLRWRWKPEAISARFVALVAGIIFFFLAVLTQGVLPFIEPSARTTEVTAVVRTDYGQLKWMLSDATDYTPTQQLGRQVYLREGCWYCHSQYVRPVTGETRRWGPVSEAGEYAYDVPHLFGTRRIGPDLTRVGLKYSNEWHLAHFWNPRELLPDSIMAPYRALFETPREPVKIVDDGAGNRTLENNAITQKLFDFESKVQIKLTPNAGGLLFVPLEARDKAPAILIPNNEYIGNTVTIAAETKELEGLIAYLQKLGMNRGKWRDVFEPQQLEVTQATLPRSSEWIDYGRVVYERRCVGCHGVKGDGNGPAATFLYRQRPRSFAAAVFKFRLTKEPVPTDGDLLRTITRGVRGTAMPPWYELPLTDRLAVIQYIKYELAVDRSDPAKPYSFFIEEPPGAPLYIQRPPAPSQQILARGKEVWRIAKCWECHGNSGKGDGEKAAGLKDDLGFPIPPADLTTGQFKSGPAVEDIFRTMTTGLSGTPMPNYRDSLPEEDRWALAYYVLSLSAFTDPITGEPLPITSADRTALNDPKLQADTPDKAYIPNGRAQRTGGSKAARGSSRGEAAAKQP
ncbi:cbb3-type cytochrome c oxidase subunit II [Bradyrhizobium sp. CCBAU 051011]|uniref:cbb3-type cytochrome c oxidase subunit II n=1 Tax=Bradyrhizobium sp. CCBAU 051011 TaxID=858422 RepID=UPI001FEE3088|nr:cbb3-type cytochrome c oxidase subunit II [Bradyrhizobium sp. CCBAU 051011]